MKRKYWELPAQELREYIIGNWDDEELDVCDAIHDYYDKARPRCWVDIAHEATDLWNKMFKDNEFEIDSPAYGVIDGAVAAAAAGVWDAVAEAFGLESRYVELVFANWYVPNWEGEVPKITWDEFMQRYEAEKAEWEAE
jgi:hypothetical protein